MSAPRVGAVAGRQERLLPWFGAALGVLWFLAVGGGPTLDPTNLDWLGGGDLAEHVLGWLHFRHAPWGFPLGRTPGLLYPHVMTVGFSDSNPWVSLALRPLSHWLPQDFQFIGPWLGLCFALQGWMGVKLMGLFTPRASQRLLGAALFVLAPVLLNRTGHDTLCAHWMLTAMFWLYLRPREDARAAWGALGWALLLNVLAAGVHPYLEVMVFALTLALLFATVREQYLSWRSAGASFAGGSLAVGVIFAAFGYVGQGVSSGASGFGFYSADLLTLINPMGWSRMLPGLPTGPGQYEGFGFLGTGVLALAGMILWKPSRWWPQAKAEVKARLPLVIMVVLLAVLAGSSVMTAAGRTVLTMRKLMGPLLPLFEPFRSSGRFIWPLHYAVLTGLIALVVWRWRQRPGVATGMILFAVLIQAVDTPDVWERARFRGKPWPRLRAQEWESVDPFYRHIVLFPPAVNGSTVPCVENTFAEGAYVSFGDLAYRKGLTTNSGYPARLDEKQIEAVCTALRADIESGRLAEDSLYVVDEPKLAVFQRLGPSVTCGVLDGFTVCVAAKEGRFREALMRAPSPSVPLPTPEGATPSAGSAP
ncbi:DUF6311 domain-containing protein [Vitiosangium sp. GDMCC 1.1324]|uniref:DUF6311 domain-containing protein n=1 Tax=Vitiosangium sp. (strain GDMCC 1.1324) TaxID=2138576 RepID=UPI000D36C760|nr:DUF6311 domain-containing protein [Vitiosangium sp. GDMCC 1.1324]PTL78965.1 hypothetical protein DAT35_35675 [Vitiosangium sp. GDMCC 1.1324]